MKAIKWFDRKFDCSFGMEQYASLYERLQNAPEQYKRTVKGLSENVLILKPNDKWSIKENIGHLLVLDPLWLKRFQEIKNHKTEMSPADLNNTATDEAIFNNMPVSVLLARFTVERSKIIVCLDSLAQHVFTYVAIHPRLQKPMRIVDLMHFVAEHDDHHLNTIQRMMENIKA